MWRLLRGHRTGTGWAGAVQGRVAPGLMGHGERSGFIQPKYPDGTLHVGNSQSWAPAGRALGLLGAPSQIAGPLAPVPLPLPSSPSAGRGGKGRSRSASLPLRPSFHPDAPIFSAAIFRRLRAASGCRAGRLPAADGAERAPRGGD